MVFRREARAFSKLFWQIGPSWFFFLPDSGVQMSVRVHILLVMTLEQKKRCVFAPRTLGERAGEWAQQTF